jgi:Ion channel
MSTAAVALLGFVLLAITLQDAFEVMLLPRRVMRRLRFFRLFYRLTWITWSALASVLPRNGQRERFLGLYGALSIVWLFGIWITCLILGFGLLLWATQLGTGVTPQATLGSQLYMSGVTFFTLGYGDLVPNTRIGRLLSVLESGTGLGFIAVVIGYLPVLYQFFSRREAHVMTLDGRAGSPPTAMGLLQRHNSEDGLAQVSILLREWEIWGSELLESHLSYPMLAYYRSQHEDQSWLAALAAIMDCCALILVGLENGPPLQARMTFTMAQPDFGRDGSVLRRGTVALYRRR